MISIQLTVPFELQEQARFGTRITEWDVKVVENGLLLGVLEELGDIDHMFTDTFGRQMEFTDGESMSDVCFEIEKSFNPVIVN